MVGQRPLCGTDNGAAPGPESSSAITRASLPSKWRGEPMRTLDRYLGRIFMNSWLSVNLVLAGLFSFLELARQLDDIGKGHYTISKALLYVSLTLPGRMIDMTPPSA